MVKCSVCWGEGGPTDCEWCSVSFRGLLWWGVGGQLQTLNGEVLCVCFRGLLEQTVNGEMFRVCFRGLLEQTVNGEVLCVFQGFVGTDCEW